MTISHLTDKPTSHFIRLSKNDNLVAGYAALHKNFLLTHNPYAAQACLLTHLPRLADDSTLAAFFEADRRSHVGHLG